MALTVLTRTEDVTITIDGTPIKVTVKKMERKEGIAWKREYKRHFQKRGSEEKFAALDESARDQVDDEANAFIEASITKYCSLAEGEIDVDDAENPHVLTGEQIVKTFGLRFDVLFAFYIAINYANFLGAEEKNDLRSQSVFFPGSQAPTATKDGSALASTASAVVQSSSAVAEVATE